MAGRRSFVSRPNGLLNPEFLQGGPQTGFIESHGTPYDLPLWIHDVVRRIRLHAVLRGDSVVLAAHVTHAAEECESAVFEILVDRRLRITGVHGYQLQPLAPKRCIQLLKVRKLLTARA